MGWVTLKATRTREEAELLQQMLTAHDVPARVIMLDTLVHIGCTSTLQVRLQDRWTALLLLSPTEEAIVDQSDL
ncbi:MAG: hypothetical protein HC881_12350 [Leptolyngbyaceae cyanobacterium SL_7_1]|nr:hypothetical protein [Leptolyngbyaceae cyanobacterium SL_7_1]